MQLENLDINPDTAAILARLALLDEERVQKKVGAREHMLNEAHALVASLQTPSDFIARITWAEPALQACVRTSIDLKLFEHFERSCNGVLTPNELAMMTGAEEAFVSRLLKHLAAMNVIAELAQGQYTNTKLSKALIEPKYRDGIKFWYGLQNLSSCVQTDWDQSYDVTDQSFREMPTYFAKTGYKNPLNPVDGPFQFAINTKLHFFHYLAENPKYLEQFSTYMAGYRQGKLSWIDSNFFPVQERLIKGYQPSAAFLVDIGGGKGHDLIELNAQFSNIPGKLVLQDLPELIEQVEKPLPSGMEAMVHDFFTEQPIKHARAYYLHSIFHNWDDESCLRILQALKPAMKPGYSKLLINDLIVPDRGADWSVTSMDWIVMSILSVRERTESEFRSLLERAGYKVDRIWTVDQGTESIIEASIV